MPVVAYHVVLSGRVQGVGFRFSAVRAATRLGVLGWVRNCYDGTVEAHCEGEPENIAKFLEWLRKGPPGAYVAQMEKRNVPPHHTYRAFTIDY